MKTLKIPDETFEFLAWLVRQDVTLPNVMADYLKWDMYTREQTKAHFHALHNACLEAREKEARRKRI